MTWDSINISNKIIYLKALLLNSTTYKDKSEYQLNALITGSYNDYDTYDIDDDDGLSFRIDDDDIRYMKELWNDVIDCQVDNYVIDQIKYELNK